MNQPVASTRKLMKIAESAIAKGRGQEAWDALQQVIRMNPEHVEAYYQSGRILHAAGEYAKAEQYLTAAIRVNPQHMDSYGELLLIMGSQNRPEDAINLAKHMVQTMPNEVDAHVLMVNQLMQYNQTHVVPEYIKQVLPHFPDNLLLLQNHIFALKINRRYEEAEQLYESVRKQHRLPLYFRMLYELYLPRVYDSAAEIDKLREQFRASIESLIKDRPPLVASAYKHEPIFQLAYHNRDNKEMLQRYNHMLRIIAPELNYKAKHCKAQAAERGTTLHVGFISKHMHEHSVGNCYRSVMINLANHPDFKVTFFNIANVMDEKMQEIINSKVQVVSLPKALEAAQQSIDKFKLDILIYPDIGMDPMTHYLAMARLAPKQLVLHGHPETTGIDTIDYFISSRIYEAPGAQENYSEQLLCIDGVDSVFKQAAAPAVWLTREELGLPADKKLYVCPMAIQKFHPDFDHLLKGILDRDPDAIIVLFNDFMQQSASSFLHERITNVCGSQRLIFLPWLSLEKLLSVLHTADALLDTIYFGGGTTIQYTFGLGLPMVSMPTRYVRGRVCCAYYQVMGIHNPPLAASPEEYISLAVKLAHSPEYRAQLMTQIEQNKHKLYNLSHSSEAMVQLLKDISHGDVAKYAPAPR